MFLSTFHCKLPEPRHQVLKVLALGGTEPATVEGEVVVIADLDDIKVIYKTLIINRKWMGMKTLCFLKENYLML